MKLKLTNNAIVDINSYINDILCNDLYVLSLMIPAVSDNNDLTRDLLIQLFTENDVVSLIGDDESEIPLTGTFTSLLPDVYAHDIGGSTVFSLLLMTDEDALIYINTVRNMKLTELSAICKQQIELGLTLDLTIGQKTLSYKDDDRENIKQMFDAVIYGATAYPYHSDGESCISYSAQDIITIYVAMVKNKTHHTTYFNQLKQMLLNSNDMFSIGTVKYGQELTGTYLDVYNTNMAEAELQFANILSKIVQE